MIQLLSNLDLIWKVVLLAPIAIALAAWALKLACSFSSIKPPRFPHAVLSVVALFAAHLAVRYYLDFTQVSPGLGRVVIAPLITWAAVVGICMPTGPLSAVSVAVFHASICLLLFISLAVVGDALIMPLLT